MPRSSLWRMMWTRWTPHKSRVRECTCWSPQPSLRQRWRPRNSSRCDRNETRPARLRERLLSGPRLPRGRSRGCTRRRRPRRSSRKLRGSVSPRTACCESSWDFALLPAARRKMREPSTCRAPRAYLAPSTCPCPPFFIVASHGVDDNPPAVPHVSGGQSMIRVSQSFESAEERGAASLRQRAFGSEPASALCEVYRVRRCLWRVGRLAAWLTSHVPDYCRLLYGISGSLDTWVAC